MKLYTRDEIDEMDGLGKSLLEELLKLMEENLDTYMPGFTHLQKAQPITLAHHMGDVYKRQCMHRVQSETDYTGRNGEAVNLLLL